MPVRNEEIGWSWRATLCVPIDPMPKELGEDCVLTEDSVDDCGAYAMCWGGQKATEGVCRAFCAGEAYSCDSGFHCPVNGSGDKAICLPNCDPLAQICPAGDSCLAKKGFGSEDFSCEVDASGDAGVFGDSCEFLNSCDPGLFCVSAEHVEGCQGLDCCTLFCDLTEMPDSCPGASTCVPWFEEGEVPPNLQDIGFCSLLG